MDMHWKEIARLESSEWILDENFWSGITVWIDRPHLVNPKLLAAEPQETWTDICWNIQLVEVLNNGNFSLESIYALLEETETCIHKNKICNTNVDVTDDKESQVPNSDFCEKADKKCTLLLRSLLPKQVKVYQDVIEAVLIDKLEMSVAFYPKMSDVLVSNITPAFPYRFIKLNKGIILEVLQKSPEEKSKRHLDSEKWLKTKVLCKVLKWCEYVPEQPIMPSLRLISLKNYNENLNYLKTKYGKKFVQIWPHYNNTDPEKYVYEDISIAAYLITLWAEERIKLNLTKKQTFVDLGCGNGFLDHILSSEGHTGIGIDLRKRKMWNVFGQETKLCEMTFEPSDKQLYPSYDWIIGNHADELTPWIPVIAARSSYKMKVFLLPCCPYTFNGKYVRKYHQISQYQSYLNFLQELCSAMGFKVEQDRLRIPSTKRACFVCTTRTYTEMKEREMDAERTEFINSNLKKSEDKTSQFCQLKKVGCSTDNLGSSASGNASANWIQDFAPRNSVERSQNCTNVDKSILNDVVLLFFNALLVTENYITIERDSTILWNRGGKQKMADLIELLTPETAGCLKNQRGGLQTLLRNHSYIFEVQNNMVQLKVTSANISSNSKASAPEQADLQRKIFFKTKKCFYHLNHPQGCPLSSSECAYSHGECMS